MAKHKVKRYDGEEGSVVTEKRVDINNPGAYKMPERRKSDEEIEDSFSKETEPGSATPSIPEKSVSSEKTINYDSDKPKIVTKEELAKSGLTLREYMNKQQGLKPRGGSASTTTKAKMNTGMADRMVDRAYENLKDADKKPPGKGYEESKAKYEAYRNDPSPLDNIRTSAKNIGKKLGISGYAKGGMPSSASKRADGIAQRGKTRGKMY